MKRTKYLLLAFFFIPVIVVGQNDSVNFVFRLSGGYADVSSSTKTGILGTDLIKTSTGVVDFSVGLFLNKQLEFGIGVEYQKQKIESVKDLFVPAALYAAEETESNVKVFLGKFYIANHWHLFSRLYFAPKFGFGYGKANGTVKSFAISNTSLVKPDFPNLNNTYEKQTMLETEDDVHYDCFTVALTPAFNFKFTKHFTLTLETGTFQLLLIDNWDNRQWLANISPVYWNLGFLVIL